jgi:Domain of unknown function DUF29
MEELLALRHCIEERRYDDALHIINEMDDMARADKITKIESYLIILLLHCIKQSAEQATTRSWERSIRNSVESVHRTNKRRSASGNYLRNEELRDLLDEVFASALADAADEAFGGAFTGQQIAAKIDEEAIKERAMTLIIHGYTPSEFLRKQ